MSSLLNNPWVVGIVGGILSGIIVTLVSRTILSRRDRKEYVQKLLSANREVAYAIRPGISEALVPSAEVVRSLISATARKYGVDDKDLYQPKEIAQELTKEVMDSSFISPRMKEEYCAHIGPLAEEPAHLPRTEGGEVLEIRRGNRQAEIAEYRSRMVGMMSWMMGALAAVMTVMVPFIQVRENSSGISSFLASRDFRALLTPALSAILVTIMATMLMFVWRDYGSRAARRRNRQEGHPVGEASTSNTKVDAPESP